MNAPSSPSSPAPVEPLDPKRLAADFPLLASSDLVYLDSAATSQKPRAVLEAMDDFYEHYNANVHRGVFGIAARATEAVERARLGVARFIGGQPHEVVFTKNATESCNLVAQSWGRANLKAGDAVVLTLLEHHANIVPWHQLAAERGIELRWIPITPDGVLDLTDLDRILDGARLLACTAMSNVTGTLTPVRALADAAHAAGATVAVDACQYVPHSACDVSALGADLIAFSGHKMCGPTGVGVLWGRAELLDAMPAWMGGGGMIADVRTDSWTPAPIPQKFEAGTPPIAEIIGLGAAVDYLNALGMDRVRQHEITLTAYALRALTERLGDRITIFGPSEPAQRGGVLSFELEGVHPHDVSQILDERGVCVRAGHHCAKPLMRALGVNATARASVYLYNDESDVDALADALEAASDFFG